MSFIIKKFLRKMVEQYLNIYDQISLDKGQLQLPSGHLNQANINKILKAKGVPATIVYSQYTNLGLSLPIIEILSKPIVLKMESLRVVILVYSERLDNIENNKQQKIETVQSKNQQKTEKLQDKPQFIKQQKDKSTKSQKSYLKSIVNRLLTNMELQIKRLEIIIRYANRPASGEEAFQQIDQHQYKISLENLVAKNSLSLLEANILKKIICMSKFSITVHKISKQEQIQEQIMQQKNKKQESKQKITKIAEILDLNMSLNIDYTRLTMICLLDKLSIGLETKLVNWILHKLEQTKKQTQSKTKAKTKVKEGHRKKEKKKQQQNLIKPKLQGVQIKVNQIVFSLFNRDDGHNLEERKDVELFHWCILGLEIQKEKTKGYKEKVTQNGQLEESPQINQSQITINLQSISMHCRNKSKGKRNKNNQLLQFVSIKMCEKNKKLVNSTIESWNKNKRKQFTIIFNLRRKQINSISIDDLHAFFLIDISVLANIRYLTEWLNSNIRRILPMLGKKKKNKGISTTLQPKQQQKTKIPEICVKNIKISCRIEMQEQKLSISVCLPQLTKIVNSKQYKNNSIIENAQMLINKIQIHINQKNEGIAITQVKLCQKVEKIQENTYKQINRQHIISIHCIFCSFDTCTFRQIGTFFTFSHFYQCSQLFSKIKDNMQNANRIYVSQVQKKLIQIKQEQQMCGEKQQISQQWSLPAVQQISQAIKEYNIYLRVNSLIMSLGAYIKQYRDSHQKQIQSRERYNPIIMLQTQTIKALLCLKQKNQRKANIKMSLKSISCISPHNLSHGSILKYPVRVKLFHSTNYSNNDKNTMRKQDRSALGQDANLNGCNYGMEILDPIHIDLQQQYIYLLANLYKNITPHHNPHKPTQSPESQTFTTITNLIKQQITLQYNNITSSSTISSNKSMTQNKNLENGEFQNTNNVVFKQYCVSPGCSEQIYLFDMCVSILINGELSEPIILALPNIQNKYDQIEPSIQIAIQKSGMESGAKQKIGKNGEQTEIEEQKKQKQKQKSLNETKANPNTNLHQDSKLQMQKAIIFPYHDQCRYILQIDYQNGHLKLSIKYKYQLHLFEGVEQYCGLKMLEIRCIKFDKYEKFVPHQLKSLQDIPFMQVQPRENIQMGANKSIIAMDWQLLEQEKLQHLSFLIQTFKTEQYKVHRLMTNSIKYKIYGLYPMRQKKQMDTNKPFNQIYHYYILEEAVQNYTHDSNQHSDLNAHHYYLMPFLILINNLSNHDIKLNITNKKSSLAQEYELKAQRFCMPCDENFDYYMKQYMIRLQIKDSTAADQDLSIYESQEHYFNTFFMVDESFQNVIELRCAASKANLNFNNQRHIRMRESFIKKTKILQIQDCLNLQNKTDYNLHVQILAQTMGKTFKNIGSVSQANKYSMELSSHSQKDYPIKLKKNDKILISYVVNGNKQNSIQVPISKLNQNNNKLLLSYNFCKKDHKNIHKHHHQKRMIIQENQQMMEQQKYYQILIKLELKTFSHNTQNLSYNSSNLQSQLVFTPFLTFTNLCSRNRKLKMNNSILQSCYQNMKGNKKQDYSISLCLPSNTNKDYNNKYLIINTQQIYQDLLVNSRNWIMQGNNHYLKIQLLPLPHSKSTTKHQVMEQKSQSITHSIYLNELITHKTLQFNKSVYSLIKNLKDDIIELYFSDHLFNTNVPARYFVFNNSTQYYFLMNSSQTQYAKYLLFPNQFQDENNKIQLKEQKQYHRGTFKKQMKVLQQQAKLQSQTNNSQPKSLKIQSTQQKEIKTTQTFDDFLGSKVHIEGKSKNPVSIMLNKDKHDIFLCDSQYHKLESLTVRKLQKLKIKQEKYQIQNFTILDFQSQNYNKKSQALQTSPQYQFSTSTITLKLFSKRKNCGIINEIKSISMRHFQNDKTDILIQDISVSVGIQMQQLQLKSSQNESTVTQNIGQSTMSQKSKLQFFQILRIPEQSYVLVEGKSYLEKLVLVKNIYIKCKIIDLHVNRQLLIVLSYFGKVGKFLAQLSKSTPHHSNQDDKKHNNQNKDLEYKQAKKIQKLVKQKILLIKSVYIHPINLCLAVQTNPTMDFSNMITLPEYTISNKVYRISNISKQISNHYLANVIAKFPKLSFIYQNLRNPISMVKSILETRNILISNQKEQQRKKIAWAMSYVDLQKKYFGFSYIKFPQKRLTQFLGFHNRKSDPQLDRVNQILLQITLDYPQNVRNRQIFICVLKNVVSSNITKLSQMVNVPLSYYLTNKNVRVISPNLPGELVSLKQIQSARVVRYNKKNAELVITFRRRGTFIKIVDQFIICHNLISSLNSLLM